MSFSLRRALVAADRVRSLLIGPPTKTLNASLPPNVKAALRWANRAAMRIHGAGPCRAASGHGATAAALQQALVTSQVILRHPSRREASTVTRMRCRSSGYLLYGQRSPPLPCRPQFAFNELMTDTPTLPPLTAHCFHMPRQRRATAGSAPGAGLDEVAFLVASGTSMASISWPLMALCNAGKRRSIPSGARVECKFLQNRCARLGRIARIQQWQGETDCLWAPGSTILPWSYSH